MASPWSIFAFYLLPPPLVIIVLLLLPLPRTFHKGLLLFCKAVLALPFLGPLRVEWFFILLSGVTYGGLTFQYLNRFGGQHVTTEMTPNQKAGIYASKWRMERNWWIAAFSFFSWCVLARFHHVLLHKIKLQEKVDALEKRIATFDRPAAGASYPPIPSKPGQEAATPSAPPLPLEIEKVPQGTKKAN